ncbi:MAG: FHA domain-containing protein [Pirellulaceae bacterium]|nr:FHA domain-containing protein [Pirellulaceae bacterium]
MLMVPTIVICSGTNQGQTFPLQKDCIVIGRQPDCDIPLASIACSRRHSQLVRTESGYSIEDLNSRSGTYVNYSRIQGRTALNDGDHIRVADVLLKYQIRRADMEPGAS